MYLSMVNNFIYTKDGYTKGANCGLSFEKYCFGNKCDLTL